jgi:hypothetical protein
MVSSFNAMLIKSMTGLVQVRRCLVALRFGCAMGNPLFSGMPIGVAAIGAFASHSQIDDFSHAKTQRLRFARSAFGDPRCSAESRPIAPIRWQGLPLQVLQCANPHISLGYGFIRLGSEAIFAGLLKIRLGAIDRHLPQFEISLA